MAWAILPYLVMDPSQLNVIFNEPGSALNDELILNDRFLVFLLFVVHLCHALIDFDRLRVTALQAFKIFQGQFSLSHFHEYGADVQLGGQSSRLQAFQSFQVEQCAREFFCFR